MADSDQLLEFGSLGAYLLLLLWIGIRSSRQVNSSLDYTLAARSVPWAVVLGTTAATMIGGGASVGMVSKVYQVGIAAALITCAWHLQLIFTGLMLAPRLRSLNLTTVGDFFHIKFGPLARELSVVHCVIFLIGALVAQMAAIGTVANAVLGVSYERSLIIGAAVVVFYSTVGGMRAVITTDVLQFVILVFGIGAAAGMLLIDNGGFEGMLDMVGAAQFQVTSDWSGIEVLSIFVAFLLGEVLIPPYAVRCFVAKSASHARWGVAGAGLFLLLFMPISTFTLGTSAILEPEVRSAIEQEKQRLMTDQSLSDEQAQLQAQQIAFPVLVRATFHPMFTGIMVAAIIAAVMSSADSCLSCLSTLVMEDYYRRHIDPASSDRRLLRVAQFSTLVAGVSAAVGAYYFRNIADILVFVYDFWAPGVVFPFMVAIFWYKRTRIYAVVASMILGTAATVLWRFVFQSPWQIGPALFGFVVAVVTFLVCWPLTCRWTIQSLVAPGDDASSEGGTP